MHDVSLNRGVEVFEVAMQATARQKIYSSCCKLAKSSQTASYRRVSNIR